jgi:hypothetical protein
MEQVLPWLCCCCKLRKTKHDDHDHFSALLQTNEIQDAQEIDERLEKIIRESEAKQYEGKDMLKFEKKRMESIRLSLSRCKREMKKKPKMPFSEYGPGITAYFHFLLYLLFTYAVLCIMIIPVIYIYRSHNGYDSKYI